MNEPVWASWHEQANERTAARLATQQQADDAYSRIQKRRAEKDRRLRCLDTALDVTLAVTIILCVTALCFLVK